MSWLRAHERLHEMAVNCGFGKRCYTCRQRHMMYMKTGGFEKTISRLSGKRVSINTVRSRVALRDKRERRVLSIMGVASRMIG